MLFGGAKGGGKTAYLVACAAPILELAHRKWLATGVEQRQCRIMVFRRNLNDLKDFAVKGHALFPLLDPQMGPEGYKEKEKFWRFSSGATVEMHHLDGPTDHLSFNGQEFTALFIDECQFVPFEAYSFLAAQVRSSDADYRKVLIIRLTANPGGPHGDWVRDRFQIDAHPEGGKIFRYKTKLPDGREVETTRAFVRSFLRDNPHLDPDGTYEAFLRSTMNPDEVKQYMDGDFNTVAGAFFSHVLRTVHFVKSKPVPASWDKIFSIDWGSTAPACCLWGAQDDADGRVYIIDELHQPGITGRTFGEALVGKYTRQKWCKDKVYKPGDFWGVIDTQAMDRYGSESTAAAGIMEWGFRIFGADKLPGERATGINQIKERLLMDRQDQPQMVIFEDRCPHLVRALKGIQSLAPIDPEDYDPKSPLAHAVDALRFMLLKMPVRKVLPVDKTDIEVARWNRILKRQKPSDDDEARTTGGYDR